MRMIVYYSTLCLISCLLQVENVIANEANNTDAVEIAIESIRTVSVNNSSPADLKEATEKLVLLADARAGVQKANVSEREISVSLSFSLSFCLFWLKFLIAWVQLKFFPFLHSLISLSRSFLSVFLYFLSSSGLCLFIITNHSYWIFFALRALSVIQILCINSLTPCYQH